MPDEPNPTGTSLGSSWRTRAAACADALAAGFSVEPLYTFMCPDERRRRDAGSFRARLWALGSAYDLVDFCEEADGTVSSVALWEPGTPTALGAMRSSVGIRPQFWW